MDKEIFDQYLQFKQELSEATIKIIKRFRKKQKVTSSKHMSKISIVQKVLNDANQPLHISEIIERARNKFEIELERDSIVSILVKKIKSGKQFIRTAPNTFALKSMETINDIQEKK